MEILEEKKVSASLRGDSIEREKINWRENLVMNSSLHVDE